MNLIFVNKCISVTKTFCFMTIFFLVDLIACIIPCLLFILDFCIPDSFRKSIEDFLMFVSQFPAFPLIFARNKNVQAFFYRFSYTTMNRQINLLFPFPPLFLDPCHLPQSSFLITKRRVFCLITVDIVAIDAFLSQFNRVSHLRGIFKISLFHIPIVGTGLFHV